MSDPERSRPRRRRRASEPEESPGGAVALRIFTLADYAAVAPDQKLYISGANIQYQFAASFPLTVSQLYLVVLLAVPWHLASEPHQVVVRMLDDERQPIGPNPLLDGQAEPGRPPGTRAGEEIAVPVVLNLAGLQVEHEALVYFHVEVDGSRIAVQPFRFRQLPMMPGAMPAGQGPT